MTQKIAVPEILTEGWVAEWIPWDQRGERTCLKFYTNNGQEVSRQELSLFSFFDFVALAENVAQENGLTLHCSEFADKGGSAPVRCIFINPRQSHT